MKITDFIKIAATGNTDAANLIRITTAVYELLGEHEVPHYDDWNKEFAAYDAMLDEKLGTEFSDAELEQQAQVIADFLNVVHMDMVNDFWYGTAAEMGIPATFASE